MLYRNLLAMDTEEALRSLLVDGRGADGWLRQDDAWTPDGRHQHEPAGDLSAGRSHVARKTGTASRWAVAPICGSTGRSAAPANVTDEDWNAIEGGHRAVARLLHDDGDGPRR